MLKKFALFLLTGVCLVGCGKHEAAGPAPAREKIKVSVEDAGGPATGASVDASVPPPVVTDVATDSGVAGGMPGEPVNPQEVKAAVDLYFERVGNFPNSWQEMIKGKFITAVPMGKNGKPLDFVECIKFLTRPK